MGERKLSSLAAENVYAAPCSHAPRRIFLPEKRLLCNQFREGGSSKRPAKQARRQVLPQQRAALDGRRPRLLRASSWTRRARFPPLILISMDPFSNIWAAPSM